MRAEAQAHIDSIKDALALLRRFLDWDRALRRLDELNARVEDQALWNDPKAAQAVMRERRRLDEAITATRAIESELNDTAELIEMAEAEGVIQRGTATVLRDLDRPMFGKTGT
ncbi:MAG: PCRF domain-containing protein, partial [Sphingomonas sp.]